MMWPTHEVRSEHPTEDLMTCQRKQAEIPLFYTVSLGPALCILIILSFARTRRGRWPTCCGGRPGIVVPLNLVDEFNHRWAYAFAFGATTNTILSIFTGTTGSFYENTSTNSVKVLLSFSRALEICVNYYPFFACLYTEKVVLGSVLGLLYSLMWMGIKIKFAIDCIDPIPEVLKDATLWTQTPTILCLAFLVCKFLRNIVEYFWKKNKQGPLQRVEQCVAFPFQVDYVKDLLRKPPASVDWKAKDVSAINKVKAYFRKYFYDSRVHFRFSTRIICTLTVIFMCNYQMSVIQMCLSGLFRGWLGDLAARVLNETNLIPTNATRTFKENLATSYVMIKVSWDVATALAFATFTFGIVGTVSNYRTNLLSLYRGDRSFVSKRYETDTANFVSNSMKYSGYQIAFLLWGHLVMSFTLLVMALLVSFVIVLPVTNGYWGIVRFIAELIILPLIISTIIRYVQYMLAKHGFLQDKIHEADKDKPLAVTNRRWLHVANYFFFVANIATGLFSSLLRILMGLLFGIFYLGRLDRCVLMTGFESMDKGYTAYLGMLQLEHYHNNPVLRVFCHVLLHSLTPAGGSTGAPCSVRLSRLGPAPTDAAPHPEPQTSHYGSVSSVTVLSSAFDGKAKPGVEEPIRRGAPSVLARRRWWVAYTLVRNPELVQYRYVMGQDTKRKVGDKDLGFALAQYRLYRRMKATVEALHSQFLAHEMVRSFAVQTDPTESDGQHQKVEDSKPSVEREVNAGDSALFLTSHGKNQMDRDRGLHDNPAMISEGSTVFSEDGHQSQPTHVHGELDDLCHLPGYMQGDSGDETDAVIVGNTHL